MLPLLASLLLSAASPSRAQDAFTFGTRLGGFEDPLRSSDTRPSAAFADQRSFVFDNRRPSSRGLPVNPFAPITDSRPSDVSSLSSAFDDFFASSKLASPPSTPVRPATTRPRPAPVPAPVPAPAPAPRPVPTAAPTPAPTAAPRQRAPSPSPSRSRGESMSRQSAVRPPAPARRQPQPQSPRETLREVASRRPSSSGRRRGSSAPADVSSRGRKQQAPRPTTTPRPQQHDVGTNLVGASLCGRGVGGDLCRKHLADTARTCTDGFCAQCQQCHAVGAAQWPECCRRHHLCCREVGHACQTCDLRDLQPFCAQAFGRCQ